MKNDYLKEGKNDKICQPFKGWVEKWEIYIFVTSLT